MSWAVLNVTNILTAWKCSKCDREMRCCEYVWELVSPNKFQTICELSYTQPSSAKSKNLEQNTNIQQLFKVNCKCI